MAIRKMAASGKTGNTLERSVMRLEPPARVDKQAREPELRYAIRHDVLLHSGGLNAPLQIVPILDLAERAPGGIFFRKSPSAQIFVGFLQMSGELFDHFALFSGLYCKRSEFCTHQLFPIASRSHWSGARQALRMNLAGMEDLDRQCANQQRCSRGYDPAKQEAQEPSQCRLERGAAIQYEAEREDDEKTGGQRQHRKDARKQNRPGGSTSA